MTAKQFITAWAKYLSASEKIYLVLLENVMDYWVLKYHEQDVKP